MRRSLLSLCTCLLLCTLSLPSAQAASLAQQRQMYDEAKRALHLPICAIGGITLDNAAPLVAHGVDLLAVVHGLFGADSTAEVTRRARAFNELFKS